MFHSQLRFKILRIWIMSAICFGGALSGATERVYVGTESGFLHGFDGFQRGRFNFGSPGDTSFASVDVDGEDSQRAITNLAAGNISGPVGSQVLVGTNDGIVRSYVEDLSDLSPTFPGGNNPSDGNGPGVFTPNQGLAIGSLGSLNEAIAMGHPIPDPTRGVSILVMNPGLAFEINTAFTGPPDPDLSAIAFADVDPHRPGKELLIAVTKTDANSTDPTPPFAKSTGFISAWQFEYVGIAQSPTLTPVWLDTNGSPWFPINNTITDIVTGDFIANPTGAEGLNPWEEIAVLGNTPDGHPTLEFGKGVQTFQPRPDLGSPAPFPQFIWQNAMTEAQDSMMVAGVAADVRSDTPGLEIVAAGSGGLRIINGQTGATIQHINTSQPLTDVVVADVLGNDGIPEIVVGTAASSGTLEGDYNGNGLVDAADFTVWRDTLSQIGEGLAADGDNSGAIEQADYDIWKENLGSSAPTAQILVFEHTNLANLSSDFGIDTTNFTYGASFDLPTSNLSVASLATLPANGVMTSGLSVPEPTSAIPLMVGLLFSRCRLLISRRIRGRN